MVCVMWCNCGLGLWDWDRDWTRLGITGPTTCGECRCGYGSTSSPPLLALALARPPFLGILIFATPTRVHHIGGSRTSIHIGFTHEYSHRLHARLFTSASRTSIHIGFTHEYM
jgi:hypothetical protein